MGADRLPTGVWRRIGMGRDASGHFSFNLPCFCLFLVHGGLITIDLSKPVENTQ